MGIDETLNWAALAIWGLSLGCSAHTETSAEQDQLRKSSGYWSELKGSSERQYRYTSQNASWTGHHSRSTLHVSNDKVVARTYEGFNPEGMIETTWTEDATSLGSHTEGSPLLTIDQIYERCGSEVLSKDPAHNWITLTFREDHVLEHCSYFPKNCADDCAVGFNIASLELL